MPRDSRIKVAGSIGIFLTGHKSVDGTTLTSDVVLLLLDFWSMPKRHTRTRKGSSVIAVAIESEWWFSAILSVGIFAITFYIIPALAFKNMFLRTFTVGLRPMMAVLGGTFALIALFKFFRQSKSVSISSARDTRTGFFSVPQAQNNNVSSTREHQVIHGLSKDNTQWGNLGSQSNPLGASKRPASWSIELLQQIEWKLFEDLSTAYYQEKGIRAELTKLGADGGIDIKLFQDNSGKPTSIVQCKAWNSFVGVKPIREFLGVMTHEKISKGFYMTSSFYSPDAKEIAQANRITLIDGTMFLAMIKRLPADAQQRLLDLVTKGDYTTPSCPQCGVKMLMRSSKQGDFWGCKNFPRCRQKLHVKSGQ